MRIAGIIVGTVLVIIGIVWTLQGSNVFAGSVMSGQSMWLWIGMVVAIVGLVLLVWALLRRA